MAITIPVYGTKIEWSNDGVTYAPIPKPKNVVIPEVQRDYRDVTNLDSPNGFREWQKGLKDAGEFTLECLYTKEGYAAAAAKEALSTAVYFRTTLVKDDDQSTGDQFVFRGHVTPSIPQGDVEGDIMLNINIRTTGDVAWTQGAAA